MAFPALGSGVRRRGRIDLGELALSAGLVGAAFVAGYVLLRAASVFGDKSPVVVLAIPLLPIVAFAILNDARIGVAAIIATFPVGVSNVPVLPLQLVQLAVLAIAVIVAFRRLTSGQSPLPITRPMLVAVAFCVWLVVALPSSVDGRLSSREVVLWAIGVVTASVVVAACPNLGDVRVVLGVLLAIAAASSLTVVSQIGELHAAFGGAVINGRARGIFIEPNQLGTFSGTGALIGLGLLFSARTMRSRWLIGLGTAPCVLALLLSLSRGAWIGFFVGALVLLFKVPSARRALVLGGVPLLLAAFAFGSFAPSTPQVEIVGERLKSITGEKNPYDSRPALWSEAVREISVDPLTGHGPGAFPVASTRATSKSRTVFGEHAHNQLLTWASEDGIPAAMLAVLLAVIVHVRLKRAARRAGRYDQALIAGVAAALAAVAGQGIVDYTLRNSVILTTLFILLGCAFALDRVVPARR